jgi:hypothetical protein
MSRLSTAALLLLLMVTPAFATEAPSRNEGDAAAQVSHSRDAGELAEFEAMVAALCDAYEDRMPGRYREVNDRLQHAMAREIEQARLSRDRAVNEERRSRRDTRAGRMQAGAAGPSAELGAVFDDGGSPGAERRSRRSAFNRCEEMVRVGTLSGALQNDIARGYRSAMAKNIELAGSFLGLMRADAARM